VCRQQHPVLSEPLTIENLRNYDHSSFMTEGQSHHALRQRIDDIFPERQISFSSYNMFTTASLIGSSDMLCIMPSRLYH
ncbi:LysR family transcriptional regulator, partial [Escherichia coli]|nr:LysR family transcriptional regulator [Escherichia coli]